VNTLPLSRGVPRDVALLHATVTPDEAHVDHEAPLTFRRLVEDYIEVSMVDVNAVIILGDVERRFADASLATSWSEYHRGRARLRVISARANLGATRQNT